MKIIIWGGVYSRNKKSKARNNATFENSSYYGWISHKNKMFVCANNLNALIVVQHWLFLEPKHFAKKYIFQLLN